MVVAQKYKVRQGSMAALPPRNDVVGLAGTGRLVAARERATPVAHFECCPDWPGHQALRATHVEWFGLAVHHGRQQVGVAGELAQG